jgi:hypothetical protein
VRFPLSAELLRRLPRHPDWRYELIDGAAFLSHRPRPLHLRRSTAVPVPETSLDIEVRELDVVADRAAVATLLLQTWSEEDPYCTFEDPAEVLGPEIERGLDTAALGAVAVDPGAVCAVALVHRQQSGAPMLSWLTVAGPVRERGLATALLALIVAELRERGVGELASAASTANTPSLRWHLTPLCACAAGWPPGRHGRAASVGYASSASVGCQNSTASRSTFATFVSVSSAGSASSRGSSRSSVSEKRSQSSRRSRSLVRSLNFGTRSATLRMPLWRYL